MRKFNLADPLSRAAVYCAQGVLDSATVKAARDLGIELCQFDCRYPVGVGGNTAKCTVSLAIGVQAVAVVLVGHDLTWPVAPHFHDVATTIYKDHFPGRDPSSIRWYELGALSLEAVDMPHSKDPCGEVVYGCPEFTTQRGEYGTGGLDVHVPFGLFVRCQFADGGSL